MKAMSEFVFMKTFNFGEAALFLIAPWFIMVLSLIVYLLLGYENMGTGRERGHMAHVEGTWRRNMQRVRAKGTGRGHGQRAWTEGMGRGHGKRAWAEGMDRVPFQLKKCHFQPVGHIP